MDMNSGINIFRSITEPIMQMINVLQSEYIEYSCEECLEIVKSQIKSFWSHICTYFENGFRSQMRTIFTLDEMLTILSSNEKQSKFDWIDPLRKCLKNQQVVNVVLVISIINNFKTCSTTMEINSDSLQAFMEEQISDLHVTGHNKNLLLCAHQIEVCLDLLVSIYQHELVHDVILKQLRLFALNRFQWCLKEMFSDDQCASVSSDASCGTFIRHIDKAMELLVEIDVEDVGANAMDTYEKAKLHIDELLGHAMSIAQVAIDLDAVIIKAVSQKVLNECEQFLIEYQKTDRNVSVCNLLIDTLTEALIALEQRVNTAVLRLFLKVFKNCDRPLHKLQEYIESRIKDSPSANDLDSLIISFDLHVDRIMQISLFAIACSTHKQRVLRMRSALASLESLEGELVPNLTSLYLERNMETHSNAELLTKHWFDEADILQDLIHLIIDPSAFAQVVFDSCKVAVEKIQHHILVEKIVLAAGDITPICDEAALLVRHLNLSLPEIYVTVPTQIQDQKRSLLNVLDECNSAVRILLLDTIPDLNSMKRILKRLQILLTMIKRLSSMLLNIDIQEKDQSVKQADESKKELDEIVDRNPLPNNKTMKTMALIMLRGETLRKDRSILYQTPKKRSEPPMVIPVKELSLTADLSRKRNGRSVTFACSSKFLTKPNYSLDESLKLNITEILEHLSSYPPADEDFTQ